MSGISSLLDEIMGFPKFVYRGVPCEMGKMALGLLVRIMCMVLLGYRL